MLKKEYYCLIAGLPDLLFNENKLAVNSHNFREELQHQLSLSDYKLVEYLFLPFDNKNLLNLLFKQNKPFDSTGLLSKIALEEELQPLEEESTLPQYMQEFIKWMQDRNSKEFTIEAENILHSLFFEYILTTKNHFLRNWFLFELNIRNLLTAFNCIRYKYELEEQLLYVQENGSVYHLLLNRKLKPELFEDDLPYNDHIFRIAESDATSIDKEKMLDRIKWNYLDEHTFFHYFTIEKILSFVIKLQILERWVKLDIETGRQLLDRLINDIKTSYEFPAEFSLIKKQDKMLTKGKVAGIIANLVIVEVDGPVSQNEICYINHAGIELMAEVIRIGSRNAYIQVFESTRGLKTGTRVEFTGHMLEATLGPGILSKNFDGLQHDLDKMSGIFLQKGDYTHPLEIDKLWPFKPLAKIGDKVEAGSWLGEVTENWIPHKIMVPFKFKGEYKIKEIKTEGEYKIYDTIAVLENKKGDKLEVSMVQKWPVKIPIRTYSEKPRPFDFLETGIRVIDSLNPIVEGGTGFIPGPFGTGKTVLQHALMKQAEADMIVVAACGERANEVVEIFAEFPELDDPRTGRKLMERTTIIANTSNMPVAAREASVYTAMTIAEYYRSMGLKILLLADSTSRWAQALREMSNRMEELPGPDAFPMDLPAIISNFYARAGYVYLNNGKTGSVTFIGTVSPAGGNLKEPVTEATKKAARCFYSLSQNRADSKRYPAIDAVDSYSKYLEYPEFNELVSKTVAPNWVENILKAKNILIRGREAYEQINILGDDGVPINYHEIFWKSEIIDFIILQQDAFDKIDASTPIERQKYMMESVLALADTQFEFENFEEVNPYFKRIINVFKQMNYSEFESEQFKRFKNELQGIIKEKAVVEVEQN